MAKVDQSRMAERPEGVSEELWRAKLAYEAVEHERGESGDVSQTDYRARDAAEAVVRGEEPPKDPPKPRSRKAA